MNLKWVLSVTHEFIRPLQAEDALHVLDALASLLAGEEPQCEGISPAASMAIFALKTAKARADKKSADCAKGGLASGGNPALKKGKRSSTAKKKPAQAAQVDGQDVETHVQEPDQETFIQIVLNDGTFYPVTLQDVEEFRQYYPAVDVESEIRKVAAWSKNNPTKRKTRGGVRKFINGWLSRAQDKGGSSGDEYMKPQGQQAPMVKPYYESPFKLMWQAELAKEEAEKQNAGS